MKLLQQPETMLDAKHQHSSWIAGLLQALVTAAADEQTTKGFHPDALWSRVDQYGEARLRHSGNVTAPATHATGNNTLYRPTNHDGALQQFDTLSPKKRHTQHTHTGYPTHDWTA